MWRISAEQLFNAVNGELVSCLGRKNRASQLNQRYSDVYHSAGNFSRGWQPWRTQDDTLGQVRKIWAVWLLHPSSMTYTHREGGGGERGEPTVEKVRGATVHKAGSKVPTWLIVSLINTCLKVLLKVKNSLMTTFCFDVAHIVGTFFQYREIYSLQWKIGRFFFRDFLAKSIFFILFISFHFFYIYFLSSFNYCITFTLKVVTNEKGEAVGDVLTIIC